MSWLKIEFVTLVAAHLIVSAVTLFRLIDSYRLSYVHET